jgi:hypothetical protein
VVLLGDSGTENTHRLRAAEERIRVCNQTQRSMASAAAAAAAATTAAAAATAAPGVPTVTVVPVVFAAGHIAADRESGTGRPGAAATPRPLGKPVTRAVEG